MATASPISNSPGLTIFITLLGVVISSVFIIMNIYKPNSLIAVVFLYMVIYSVMMILLLNNYQDKFGSNNLHFTLNWYISYFNMFLGITMFGLYFYLSDRR